MSATFPLQPALIFAVFFTLHSHNDDLHLRETLSVQSYEVCDSPSITVIQTACLQDNSYFNYRSACTNC